MQCCLVFSYEFSCDEKNKNNLLQTEMHINGQCDTSPKNSWHFSTQVRDVPNDSNMHRANYSIIAHGSPELQHYFHEQVRPLIYNATVKNYCCVIPGYVSPDGLRGCINQKSQFAGADVVLISNLKARLETYCNRIEDIVLSGKNYAFCDTLCQAKQTALVKIYADFLKEFYASAAPHMFYNHSKNNSLMQRVMPTVNWGYYDGSIVKHNSKRLEKQRAASINGNLGVLYKALHEGNFVKAYNIGREQVTTVVGKRTEQTSVFEKYPALEQKIEDAYKVHQLKIERDRIVMQQQAVIVQTECSNHVLQKLHLDVLQQRYDVATRTILNSESAQYIHKVTPLQANCFDTDHLTSDQKGILLEGNQLQHHLVDEAITVVDTVVCGDFNEKVEGAVLGFANTSMSLNKDGDVVMAARTLDACWALVAFAKDAAQYTYSALSTHVPLIAKGSCDGICESLHGAVHMVCHPVKAAQDVVNSFVVAGYCLGKLAYTSCVLEAATDLLETNFKQYEQIIEHYGIDPGALVAVYKHVKENITTEDVTRVGTKAVVDMMLLHGITKAVSAIAQESLPAFVSCMRKGGESAEVTITAEGVPVRCTEEVASLMNNIEKAGAEVAIEAVEAGLIQQSFDEVNHIIKDNISGALKETYYEVNGFKFTQFYYDKLWNNGRRCPGFRAESVLRGATTIVQDPRGYEGFFKYIHNEWEMIFNPSTKVVAHLSPISKAKQKLI